MTRDRRFAGPYSTQSFAARCGMLQDRLPIRTAVAAVMGATVALWLLITLALDGLLF
jgi:hypothetical protein